MKTAINTRTQEEYDALMRYYDERGVVWGSGDKATTRNSWQEYKEKTCITKDYEGNGLYFSPISYFKTNGYEIIPFTEFAKANIVEEKTELKEILIRFLDEIRDYEKESQNLINDERDSSEFVEIFLNKHKISDYKIVYLEGKINPKGL